MKATEPTSKTPDKDKPTVPTVEDEETATVTETEAEQTAPEAENEETTAEVQNENTEKSNKTPIIIGIAVAVLFLGVAGGLTYYFIKKRQ